MVAVVVCVCLHACVEEEGRGGQVTRKAKVGVPNSTLTFYFGCFFQLQNRLQRALQHKGSANAPLPTAIQERMGRRTGVLSGVPERRCDAHNSRAHKTLEGCAEGAGGGAGGYAHYLFH